MLSLRLRQRRALSSRFMRGDWARRGTARSKALAGRGGAGRTCLQSRGGRGLRGAAAAPPARSRCPLVQALRSQTMRLARAAAASQLASPSCLPRILPPPSHLSPSERGTSPRRPQAETVRPLRALRPRRPYRTQRWRLVARPLGPPPSLPSQLGPRRAPRPLDQRILDRHRHDGGKTRCRRGHAQEPRRMGRQRDARRSPSRRSSCPSPCNAPVPSPQGCNP